MHGSLAAKLRVLRAERGLTVREVAAISGVAKETISQVERGERRPFDRTLAKLADAYGVPVGELLEEPVASGPKAEDPESGASQGSGEASTHSFEGAPDPAELMERLHTLGVPVNRSEATLLSQYLHLREQPPTGPVALGYVRKPGEYVDHDRVKMLLLLCLALETDLFKRDATALSKVLWGELVGTAAE